MQEEAAKRSLREAGCNQGDSSTATDAERPRIGRLYRPVYELMEGVGQAL